MNTEQFNSKGSDQENRSSQNNCDTDSIYSGRNRRIVIGHDTSGIVNNQSNVDTNYFRNRRMNIEVVNGFGINCKVEDGVLTFNTIEEFEQLEQLEQSGRTNEFIENLRRLKNFFSYNQSHFTDRSLDFIGDIVNIDGLIKIENYSIKLDFKKRLVFVSSQLSGQELNFINVTDLPPGVECYTMDEDVLSEIKNKKSRGILCRDRYAKGKDLEDGIQGKTIIDFYVQPIGGNTNGVPSLVSAPESWIVYVEYCPTGLWYKMWSECWAAPANTYGYFGRGPIDMYTSFWCQRRCGKEIAGQSLFNNVPQTSGGPAKRVVYSSPRGLKHYWITAKIVVDASRLAPWVGSNDKTIGISD